MDIWYECDHCVIFCFRIFFFFRMRIQSRVWCNCAFREKWLTDTVYGIFNMSTLFYRLQNIHKHHVRNVTLPKNASNVRNTFCIVSHQLVNHASLIINMLSWIVFSFNSIDSHTRWYYIRLKCADGSLHEHVFCEWCSVYLMTPNIRHVHSVSTHRKSPYVACSMENPNETTRSFMI